MKFLRGGRILENINLNNYIGNITFNLDNIVPSSSVKGTIKNQSEMAVKRIDVRDSLKLDGQVDNS